MSPSRFRVPAVVVFVLAGTAQAQPPYPMVGHDEPSAVRRGEAVEIKVAGSEAGEARGSDARDFTGASALLCEEPGLRAEVLGVLAPARAAGKAKGKARATRSRPSVTARA